MSSFTKPLIVKVHTGNLEKKPFEIVEEFEFYSDLFDNFSISIKKGYRTDFASVPRIFWNIIPPFGRYSKAAIIHDWLIDNKDEYNLNVHQVNLIFKEAMEVLKVHWFYKNVIFLTVELYWHLKAIKI